MSDHIDNAGVPPAGRTAVTCDRAEVSPPMPEPPHRPDRASEINAPEGTDLIDILSHSRRDFLTIFDSIPAMIWYLDRDGTILRANQGAADAVHRTVRELIGRNYYDLQPAEAARSRQWDGQVSATGRPRRGDLRRTAMPDGTCRWIMEDRVALRDKAGKLAGVMIFAQDVTETKQAQQRLVNAKKEVELYNQQLKIAAEKSEKLAEKASRANLAKSEILAGSSHDLRTPMNAIIGFAELLLDTTLDPDQYDYVETIHKSSTCLLSLINDILDFTKLEVGKLHIQIITCQLTSFIQDIRSMMESGIRHKGLDFEVEIDPRLPETFFTDPTRLRQCLVNLIGNALKFTDAGRICLRVRAERRGARPCIRFDVEDSGIGISQQQQDRIFQSYAQAEDTTQFKYGGTGLGLTITRKLVDLLGGTISVISHPGKGSVFTMVLPLVDANMAVPLDGPEESSSGRRDESAGIQEGRILVADANLPGQLTMNLLLRRIGLSVEAAADPQRLYDKLRTAAFDVVILDLPADDRQSVEMIQTVRTINRDIPIVAVAPCDVSLMKRVLAAGCSKYLPRPVARCDLYETVYELLRQAAFERKLKDIRAAADSPPSADDDQPPRPEDWLNLTDKELELPELTGLIGSLIEQGPQGSDVDLGAHLAALLAVLQKTPAMDSPDGREKLGEIEKLLADTANESKSSEVLSQLQRLCRQIHEVCTKQNG